MIANLERTEAVGAPNPKSESTYPTDKIADALAALNDDSKDPFEKMIIVMRDLMPAITEWKEGELEGLADGLEDLAKMTNTLGRAQDNFNKLKESADTDAANNYRTELQTLEDEINASTYLDDDESEEGGQISLKGQLLESVKHMKDTYDAAASHGDGAAATINKIWNSFDQKGAPELEGSPIGTKTFLDDFNKVGTGLKNTSAVVQARFQFEVGNYETYIGVYKDMFRSWKNQVQSPIDGIKRGG